MAHSISCIAAWTDAYLHWRHLLSDLNLVVHDAVLVAGMSFPFLRREVRLLHDVDPRTSLDLPSWQPKGK